MSPEKNIVRLVDQSQRVVGTGFLVNKMHVVTTAHVVANVLGVPMETVTAPTSAVSLNFPFSESRASYLATVVYWNKTDDIAGLQLETEAPEDVDGASVFGKPVSPGTAFRTFGFPTDQESGSWVAGELIGELSGGLLQLSTLSVGHTIQAGFSGSPIIDSAGNVVGVLVARIGPGNTAYAIPIAKVLSGWSEIRFRTHEPLKAQVQECPLVFLCHASEDKPAIRKIFVDLNNDGFLPWFDEEDLLPGQKWDTEIRNAVRRSDVVLVCLSRHSVSKRGYVQKEIKLALDVADEQPEDVIFVIPVQLETCQVPMRLSEYQWVDLTDNSGYKKLLRSLEVVRKTNCSKNSA